MWRNVEKTKNKVMPLFYANNSIVVFDTETTGLGSDAKIIQFSGIRFRITEDLQLEEDCTLDLYINPEEPLSDRIVEITGITDATLEHAKTESEVFDLIQYFMETADFWSAYNCSFDLRMISQMENRLGKTIAPRECIDILKLARDLIGRENVEDYKLADSNHISFSGIPCTVSFCFRRCTGYRKMLAILSGYFKRISK